MIQAVSFSLLRSKQKEAGLVGCRDGCLLSSLRALSGASALMAGAGKGRRAYNL